MTPTARYIESAARLLADALGNRGRHRRRYRRACDLVLQGAGVTPTARYLQAAARLLADAIDCGDRLLIEVGLAGLRSAAMVDRMGERL